MPVKKTVGSLIVFLAGALSGHAYYNDFQSYAENQALTSGNDWTGNSNWRVVTLDGNKVLQLAPGSGEQEVAYTGESFTGVGAGYTIQMRMRFDIGSGELSQYSGFRMDAPSSQPGAYNSRRFYFETTGYLGTGWNSVTGDGISFRQGCWYFLRVRRFGADSVTNNGGTLKIWASEFPITDNNAGTLIMNVTPPPDTDPQSAALGTFWLRGVAYGSDTVYVDELALSHGDTIMGGLLSYTEAPYDVCKANYLAANYMQALWDPVKKWLPFNEETYGDPVTRRGGYYYLEGQGRAINAFCHEADKGPVARLDLIADMAQGIINAAIPGSPGRHFYMVEGREALAYAANSDHFSLKWLQDASLEQYDVYVEKRPDSSSAWTLVDPASLTQTTTALDGGTRYTYTGSGVTVTLDSWCGVEDYAPVLTVATDSPCDVRLRLKNSASWANVADWTHFPVQSVITPSRTINSGSANAITGQLSVSLSTEEKRLLLRNDYKTYAARCPRSGWEAQANWQILDSYWLAAWDAAKAPDMVGTTSDERRIFTELALTWTGVTSVALRGAAYLEIDPNDNFFVTASADTVASGIAHNFGIKPYSPVRTSLLYAQTLGLCAAATTLVNYQHTAAATVRAAAIAAFGAAIASEDKGYYGEYLHNLIEAAWWLKQIEPTRYDYMTYVTRWANRLAARCPSPSAVPPWSDTAGRNVRGQYFANLVTGSSAYLTAANNGLAAFSLPAGIDFEKYLLDISGTGALTARPFNGYDCQGAASLLGLSGWQRKQEAGGQYIANRLVTESARFYHCDTGFVPVSSYNCHDLLPYYVGISLSTPFPTKPPTTVVGMSQYVRYDPSGAVSPTSRPIGYYIPPPAPVTQGGVIYQDNFTGSGDNTLIYTTPTVTTGGKFWVRNDPSFAANGQAVANAGAYLPFTPVAGNVYTLQGTLNPVSSGGDGWFAFGFTTVGLPFNGSPSWFLVKPSNIGGDVYSVKNGSLTALGNVTNSSNVFTIALNTTGINWVSTFSVNGTVLDTQTFTGGAPAISYIGIYANADTLATGSRITNLELIYGSVSPTFSSWATDNAGGQTADLDWDNDGVPNGVEYFMNATAGFTANPGLVGNTVTWPNGGNIPSTDYGTQFVVQTSTDLVIWEDVGEGNLDTNDGSLSYTVSGPDKQFVRLKVTPN